MPDDPTGTSLHRLLLDVKHLEKRSVSKGGLTSGGRNSVLTCGVNSPGQKLVTRANQVTAYLVLLTTLSLTLGVRLLVRVSPGSGALAVVLVCVCFGAAGSGISALLSVLERRSSGWEFSDGSTVPDSGKSQRFNLRMMAFFYCRPLLGATMGVVVYIASLAGFLTRNAPETLGKLAFWSVVGGLFAKTVIHGLKKTVENMIGE